MLLADFEEYRLQLLYYSSEMTNTMQKKMQLGQDWKNDLFKLYVFNRRLDIMLEFTPQSEADYLVENKNFFSNEEMLVLQQQINDMINTDFNLSFYLTT